MTEGVRFNGIHQALIGEQPEVITILIIMNPTAPKAMTAVVMLRMSMTERSELTCDCIQVNNETRSMAKTTMPQFAE